MSESNVPNFQPPPPPPFPRVEQPAGPTLSLMETLSGIFFEPGRVFESFRVKPRFLVAGLICIAAFLIFNVVYLQRVGYENLTRAEVEAQQGPDANPEQTQRAIDIQQHWIVKTIRYGAAPINIVFVFAAGAALYLLGATLMARSMTYPQALGVWTYSTFPPLVLAMLLNLILVFINPPTDDANIVRGQTGLVHANLSLLVDPVAHPIIATALTAFDVFALYGLFLAALGLQKVAKLSSGAAWSIVITLYIVGVVLRIAIALATGRVIG